MCKANDLWVISAYHRRQQRHLQKILNLLLSHFLFFKRVHTETSQISLEYILQGQVKLLDQTYNSIRIIQWRNLQHAFNAIQRIVNFVPFFSSINILLPFDKRPTFNKLITYMSIQRQRHTKDINPNQNYLNFIKRNQLFMQDMMEIRHEEMHQVTSPNNKYHQNSTSQREIATQDNGSHLSLGKNQKSSQAKLQHELSHLSQSTNMHSLAERRENSAYHQYAQNDEEASIPLMRTNHARHEAARQLIIKFHKNKSIEAKRSDIRQSIDRYQPNLELHAETGFKFPSIDKKNISKMGAQTMKDVTSLQTFKDGIRDRMNYLLHKSHDKKQILNNEQLKKSQEKLSISSKFHMRQQLYGLLPVFRTPIVSGHKTKNPSFQRKSTKKIPIASPNVPKEMIEHYLQQNVTSKMLLIQKSKEMKQAATIQSEQEITIEAQRSGEKIEEGNETSQTKEHSKKVIELQTIQKQGSQMKEVMDLKSKAKKQPISLTDLRYEGQLTVYEQKIRSYRQFLFMINLAHRIYDPIVLKDANTFKPEQRYKFYLGKGNNYLLVKSLLKRRFWWTVEEDPKKANFAWTQLKVNYLYQYEKKTSIESKHYKLDEDFVSSQTLKKKKSKVQPQQTAAKAGIFRAPLPPNDKKVFTNSDKHYYDQFLQKIDNPEKMLKFSNRLKHFQENFLRSRCENISEERIHNHLQFNYFIGNKKALFYNMKQYYDLQKKNVFEVIPLTYHIKKGTSDPQYDAFTKEFKRLAKEKVSSKGGSKNIWIVKPGELSNRGQGITVIDEIYELNNIIKKKQKHSNGTEKTYIIQKYIEKPLLYKNRKFDIRHYMMISRLHGVMRAYWFGQGYIRTSSYQFDIGEISESIIHLTNDAIQKYCDGYGKYEEGNKVSYNEFQRYMDSTYGQGKFSFSEMIYPKMKAIALDSVKATYLQLDPNNAEHNFQIFGLDFMIDANYNVWLIEVNTNPCLELSSKLLARLIPTMVEQSFRLTLDVIFPPPTHYPNSQKYLAPDNPLQRLMFELIFDENRDGKQVEQLFAHAKKVDMGSVDEQDETYENDGKQIELDNEIQ